MNCFYFKINKFNVIVSCAHFRRIKTTVLAEKRLRFEKSDFYMYVSQEANRKDK